MNIDIDIVRLQEALKTIVEKSEDALAQLKGLDAIAQRFEDEVKYGAVGTTMKEQVLTQGNKLKELAQIGLDFVGNAQKYVDSYAQNSNEISAKYRI